MAHTRRRKVQSSIDPTTLLEGLNPEQQEVVTHHEGAALVVAVAGAGKTRALVHRIAYLIAEHHVDPGVILAVTFSRKAADEMNDRLFKLGVCDARVGTWHSVCWEILKAERPETSEWELDDRDRFRGLVKIVLGYQHMNWKAADLTTVTSYIGLCKAGLADPGSDRAEEIAQALFDKNPCTQTNPQLLGQAYHESLEQQAQRRMLTFDDMLVGAHKVLCDDETRERWSNRFDFVLQDEAQDENHAQSTIGAQLAKRHGNYMLVGDPAQSIYQFRGAVPQKLLAFEEEWGAKVIKMHRNYRSGPEVIEAANGVIRAMDPSSHLGVTMVAERTEPAEVVAFEFADMDDEGIQVATRISEMIADEPTIEKIIPCCEKCTNALLSEHEKAVSGTGRRARVVRDADAHGTGGGDLGLQSLDDRSSVEIPRASQGSEEGGISQREVEGRSIQDGQRIHRRSSGPEDVSIRTQSHHGEDSRPSTNQGRSGPSQEREEVGQRSGESGTLAEQHRPHENTSSMQEAISGGIVQDVRVDEHHQTREAIGNRTVNSQEMAGRRRNQTSCERCKAAATHAIEVVRSIQPRDCAVFFRTNAQSRGIEEACLSNRIPYVLLGGTNFYDRKEVKDLLGYIRVASGRGSFDDVRRCINAPFRYLGKAFVQKIEAAGGTGTVDWASVATRVADTGGIQRRQVSSVRDWVALIQGLTRSIEIQRKEHKDGVVTEDAREHHFPAALLERIISDTDYMRYITRDEGAETVENNRVSNVRELVRAASRFTTVDELLDYIDNTLEQAREAKGRDKGNRVVLCSLHRSKGLEWPAVFILGCNEKILPHGRATDMDEERRLFYVGVTRARDVLHLSCVRNASVGETVMELEPSRFIEEAGLELRGAA